MKIVFLDIDGVLNSTQSFMYYHRMGRWGFREFCPIALSNLRYIIERVPGVKLVISSTWRKAFRGKAMECIFDQNSLSPDLIYGYTPAHLSDGYRGGEINEWFRDYEEEGKEKVEAYVVIDDSTDIKPHTRHFVHTDHRVGLTLPDAMKAVKMLSCDPKLGLWEPGPETEHKDDLMKKVVKVLKEKGHWESLKKDINKARYGDSPTKGWL